MSGFPSTYQFTRANLVAPPPPASSEPERHDPMHGHPALSHAELAVRIASLSAARRKGHDIEDELTALVDGWEAHR